MDVALGGLGIRSEVNEKGNQTEREMLVVSAVRNLKS